MNSHMERHPDKWLPWYVNNTLDAAQVEEIKQHLTTCDTCRKEVALLRLIQGEVKKGIELPADEMMYRRFLRAATRSKSRTNGLWSPFFAKAASILVLIQAVALFSLVGDDVKYQPAGYQFEKVVYQVRFHDSVDHLRVRELLYSMNLRIIDGPSAMGVYLVRNEVDDVEPQAILDRLEARQDVIAYVALN